MNLLILAVDAKGAKARDRIRKDLMPVKGYRDLMPPCPLMTTADIVAR